MQSDFDKTRLIVFNQINTLKSIHAGLQRSVREVAIDHDVLRNEISNISDKIYLTIFAESKGALTWGERFSFGNGGREDTGYCVFPDHTDLLFEPGHEISNNVAF